MKYAKVLWAVLLVCFASVTWAQLPPVTNGTCNVNQMTYLTSSQSVKTPITQTFVNLADLHDVNVYLTEGQCVKIELSLVFSTTGPGEIELQAMFDDSPDIVVPSSIRVLGGIPAYRTFTFVVPVETGLGPGGHHIDIQVRGNSCGSLVTTKRMLTILHN